MFRATLPHNTIPVPGLCARAAPGSPIYSLYRCADLKDQHTHTHTRTKHTRNMKQTHLEGCEHNMPSLLRTASVAHPNADEKSHSMFFVRSTSCRAAESASRTHQQQTHTNAIRVRVVLFRSRTPARPDPAERKTQQDPGFPARASHRRVRLSAAAAAAAAVRVSVCCAELNISRGSLVRTTRTRTQTSSALRVVHNRRRPYYPLFVCVWRAARTRASEMQRMAHGRAAPGTRRRTQHAAAPETTRDQGPEPCWLRIVVDVEASASALESFVSRRRHKQTHKRIRGSAYTQTLTHAIQPARI